MTNGMYLHAFSVCFKPSLDMREHKLSKSRKPQFFQKIESSDDINKFTWQRACMLHPDLMNCAAALRLVIALADYAKHDDMVCWPARRTLMIDCSFDRRGNLDRALDRLVAVGAVVVKDIAAIPDRYRSSVCDKPGNSQFFELSKEWALAFIHSLEIAHGEHETTHGEQSATHGEHETTHGEQKMLTVMAGNHNEPSLEPESKPPTSTASPAANAPGAPMPRREAEGFVSSYIGEAFIMRDTRMMVIDLLSAGSISEAIAETMLDMAMKENGNVRKKA
jgi:hypothetical protein